MASYMDNIDDVKVGIYRCAGGRMGFETLRFYAVDYDGTNLAILDIKDGVVEWYTPESIRYLLEYDEEFKIVGILAMNPSPNPQPLCGLDVNLVYKTRFKAGKWNVVLLRKGDRFGRGLGKVIDRDTVAFYNSSATAFDDEVYPLGQYVASYYKDTILEHNTNSDLILDTDVPSWRVSANEMSDIMQWLREVDN